MPEQLLICDHQSFLRLTHFYRFPPQSQKWGENKKTTSAIWKQSKLWCSEVWTLAAELTNWELHSKSSPGLCSFTAPPPTETDPHLPAYAGPAGWYNMQRCTKFLQRQCSCDLSLPVWDSIERTHCSVWREMQARCCYSSTRHYSQSRDRPGEVSGTSASQRDQEPRVRQTNTTKLGMCGRHACAASETNILSAASLPQSKD